MMRETSHEDVSLRMDSKEETDLESITQTIHEINKLSDDLCKNCGELRSRASSSRAHLDRVYGRHKRHILAARAYYDSMRDTHLAHDKLMQATDSYKRACLELDDAKDNAEVAEKSLLSALAASAENDPDPDILANLNKATQWVGDCSLLVEEARNRRQRCQDEHNSATALEKSLAHSLRRSISKAKPYYDQKDKIQMELDLRASEIHSLNHQLSEAKSRYRELFSGLDLITAAEVTHGDIMPRLNISIDGDDSSWDQLSLGDYNLSDHLSSCSDTSSQTNISIASETVSIDGSLNNNVDSAKSKCVPPSSLPLRRKIGYGGSVDSMSLQSQSSPGWDRTSLCSLPDIVKSTSGSQQSLSTQPDVSCQKEKEKEKELAVSGTSDENKTKGDSVRDVCLKDSTGDGLEGRGVVENGVRSNDVVVGKDAEAEDSVDVNSTPIESVPIDSNSNHSASLNTTSIDSTVFDSISIDTNSKRLSSASLDSAASSYSSSASTITNSSQNGTETTSTNNSPSSSSQTTTSETTSIKSSPSSSQTTSETTLTTAAATTTTATTAAWKNKKSVTFSPPPSKLMSHSAVEDLIELEQSLCELELASPDLHGCADSDDVPMDLALGNLALHDWILEEEEEEEEEEFTRL